LPTDKPAAITGLNGAASTASTIGLLDSEASTRSVDVGDRRMKRQKDSAITLSRAHYVAGV